MIRSNKMNLICVIGICFAFIITIGLYVCGISNKKEIDFNKNNNISTEYVEKIFDDSFVHVINIEISDLNWNYMIENATDEVFVLCDAVIDGNEIKNIALRPKGNSSLESIAKSNSEHFSFKIEFDHYINGNTYFGLDKLSLNNLGQDYSCMKDYLAYHMMKAEGVPAPLCSYALIQVNGEDFGLYLAVEAIEDSFCYRNYGEDYGNLYRPDVFTIESIKPSSFMYSDEVLNITEIRKGERVDILGRMINLAFRDVQEEVNISAGKYVGDNKKKYNVIFDSSVFNITNEDKNNYIEAVKKINSEDFEEGIDAENLIKYFVVHNFVNNYDSYNGVFVHNYYIHEKNEKLSMVPWDYNLAFGAFSLESAVYNFFNSSKYEVDVNLGEALSSDESFVNYPIDEPTYVVNVSDRPLIYCWLKDENYKELYYEFYREFFKVYFDSGLFEKDFYRVKRMITPYVEKNLTFYNKEDFELATYNVSKYCLLRKDSIEGQLNENIPKTIKGQEEEVEALISIDDLNMGTTIDFGGLAWGITAEDVESIMDAISGEYGHNTEGLNNALEAISKNPSTIVSVIKRILDNNKLLKEFVNEAIVSRLLMLISLVAIISAVVIMKKYRR